MRVITYNVRHSNSDSEIRNEVQRLINTGVDVIGLQEMGGHQEAIRGFSNYKPIIPAFEVGEPGGEQDCPMLVDTRTMEVLGSGIRPVTPPTMCEPGAGGAEVAEKTINWVRVRVRSNGEEVVFANTHAVADISLLGAPDESKPKRLAVFARLMEESKAFVAARRSLGQSVIYMGDFNVHDRGDAEIQDPRFPYTYLGNIDVHATYRKLGYPPLGTFFERYLDHIYYDTRSPFFPVEHRVLDSYGSDHRPLMVDFRRRLTTGR